MSELLTRKRVKAPEVASALGEIRGDWSGSLPIFLQPRDEHFSEAQVVRRTTRTRPRTSH